jgi:DeoD family purine-nucleoside phosphorylase
MMERDVHLTPRALLESVQYKEGDFSEIALVSGQMQRVTMILESLESPVENFSTFGYTFWTGTFQGKKVTTGNSGLYAPDSALVTELLCEAGVQYFVRVGSCGALSREIEIGDLIIADTALRGDGVTDYYVDDAFVPTADVALSNELEKLARNADLNVHRGPVFTTDALLKETKEVINPKIEQGAVAIDMVTSPFLTVAGLYQKKAVAMLAVSDNLITGEIGFADTRYFETERRSTEIALNMVENIYAQLS